MILHSVDRYIDETIGQFSHFILLRHCPKLLLFSDNTAFFTARRHVRRRRRRELRGQLAETVMYNSGREFVDSLLTGVIVRDVIASQICLSVCSDCRYFCIPLRSCRNAPRQRSYSFFSLTLSEYQVVYFYVLYKNEWFQNELYYCVGHTAVFIL